MRCGIGHPRQSSTQIRATNVGSNVASDDGQDMDRVKCSQWIYKVGNHKNKRASSSFRTATTRHRAEVYKGLG